MKEKIVGNILLIPCDRKIKTKTIKAKMTDQAKALLKKTIEDNIKKSDILQKANIRLKHWHLEEYYRENPSEYEFKDENEYLGHLQATHQIGTLIEENEKEIQRLGEAYVELCKQLEEN